MGLVLRVKGEIRLKDPGVALEAWREVYDFEKHDVRRGHVAVRGPEELVERIRRSAKTAEVAWALTGLAAAWQLTRFATFRLVTVFVGRYPRAEWLEDLGFREDPRGANLWLVRPFDDAVFQGAKAVSGVPCVHPMQVYLDLKAQPERSQEAAEEVRRRFLAWKAA
jgi:hypothetical protein